MEDRLYSKMLEVENHHWWFVARREIISKVVSQIKLKKDAKIVDMGCANGDNLKMLSQYGTVTALESMHDACLKAKNRNICDVFEDNLPNNIPHKINKDNNLIVMLDVLEHIEKDEEYLSELKNWIKDSGKLLITVPAYQFLWSKHDELHHHKRRYTSRQLKKILGNNGWEVKYISYFNFFLFPVALIERLKQKIFPSKVDTGLKMPNLFLNNILKNIFRLEKYFIGKLSFPFGLSIILLATMK